ncbi:Beta-lactamase hcpA precursor [Sebaldella termitidis]|uniref:TPR repeat-containing protein n=1 Tax=Sebaldella termitidis (strain ATCC 33386 / NCTC 11300) TaxID=526218 RepID=D1AMW6_SEBTE|nr:tetratricopeptide repeat protein [Sebaldella termitidis]ACZ07342.1 TPR repeat-containing protein [Sebaldella termitidis ATCC 33386]SUI22637.1 Beta-lactamase hcpA precursor [Sebaldella termitidis]
MKKKYLKFLLIIFLALLGLFCEKQNSRNDVISKASEEYLSQVDGTKPGELDSLLISGIASYGDGNKALAIRYFEKAYELGDVRGAVKLYELYNSEKDEEKIKEWEVKAAEMGEASVQNNLGVRLYKQGNFNGAEKWYLKAAEQNHLKAWKNLGYLYLKQQKYKEAEKWYLKAAENKDSDSQNNLGIIYKKTGDFNEAEKWYLEAITQGNLAAQYNLGILYEENLNNIEKAVYWYKKSAKSGYKNSKKKLKELKEK